MSKTIDLMDMIRESLPHRASGQPQSAESIERDQRLVARAEAIANLKAQRVANELPAIKDKRGRKPQSKK